MTPDQAVRLLSVTDWPPKLEHWPPRDKRTWRPGMLLVGRIEATMTLPRPDGSKKRGEPYLALYVRRSSDQRLVMFHGWHTAAEDLDGMRPAPGLLFACVYRGERDNGFEDFKYLVAPYDAPAEEQHTPRSDNGSATEPPNRAPEEGATSPAPSSGSTIPPVPVETIRTVKMAQAVIKGRPTGWQVLFQRITAELDASGELAGSPELDVYKAAIARTDERYRQGQANGGEAA
jgi:hypothetical protein